jgi:hypothetical protein
MYSDCDIKALEKMGINARAYLAASASEKRLILRRLRDTTLSTIHDHEERIAQLDYLRAKLDQPNGGQS